jgi:hypothetical protein
VLEVATEETVVDPLIVPLVLIVEVFPAFVTTVKVPFRYTNSPTRPENEITEPVEILSSVAEVTVILVAVSILVMVVIPPKEPKPEPTPETEPTNTDNEKPSRQPQPPSRGLEKAYLAVGMLEEISSNDTRREEAFNYVRAWLDENQKQKGR